LKKVKWDRNTCERNMKDVRDNMLRYIDIENEVVQRNGVVRS